MSLESWRYSGSWTGSSGPFVAFNVNEVAGKVHEGRVGSGTQESARSKDIPFTQEYP